MRSSVSVGAAIKVQEGKAMATASVVASTGSGCFPFSLGLRVLLPPSFGGVSSEEVDPRAISIEDFKYIGKHHPLNHGNRDGGRGKC